MIELEKILPEADISAANIALESYKTLDRPLSYYSNAITSGKEYFNRCKKGIAIDYKDLIAYNLKQSRKNLLILKIQKPDELIINPSEFSVKGWNQDTYNYLWGSLIRDYTKNIYMCKDWQYSKGATFECLWSLYHKKNVYDIHLNRISKTDAIKKIKEAIVKYKSINVATDFHDKLLGAFK